MVGYLGIGFQRPGRARAAGEDRACRCLGARSLATMPACPSDGEARASSTGGALRRRCVGRVTSHRALQESGAQRRWSSMTCWACHQKAGGGTASCPDQIQGGAHRAAARGAGWLGWPRQLRYPSRPGAAPTPSADAGWETGGAERPGRVPATDEGGGGACSGLDGKGCKHWLLPSQAHALYALAQQPRD